MLKPWKFLALTLLVGAVLIAVRQFMPSGRTAGSGVRALTPSEGRAERSATAESPPSFTGEEVRELEGREVSVTGTQTPEPPQAPMPSTGPGEGEDRGRWLERNRELYFDADREMLPRKLEEFRAALALGDAKEANERAWSLLMTSIAVILAKQGREELVREGEPVSLLAPSPDHHRFIRNHYVYEFHRAEFPEFFDLQELEPDKASDDPGSWTSLSSTLITGVESHASRAMKLLDY
jgi:hypothetical protein